MSPVTHGLLGWVIAGCARLDRRDRALVTIAGIIPDADGVGLIAEIATRNSAHPLNWWSDYHHVLGHNLGFALLSTVVFTAFAHRRVLTALLVYLSFHLHLLCDLIGARGPDGEQWPIPYLMPFSRAWNLTWEGQWALNAWPNVLITVAALALTIYWAWKRGHSLVEIISLRADQKFVTALRQRLGTPKTHC